MSSRNKSKKHERHAAAHRPRVKAVLGLAVAGSLLSIWLVGIHLSLRADPAGGSACNFGGYLNCDVVNGSRYSSVFGVPIAYGGLALYLLLGAFAVAELRGGFVRTLAWARGLGLLAVLYSVFLAVVSAAVLHAFCLFCVGLYLVNLGLAGLGWIRPPEPRPRFVAVANRDLNRLLERGRAWPARIGLGVLVLGAGALAWADASLGAAGAEGRRIEVGHRPLTAAPGHADGPADAALTVVEFSDFQCPYCKHASTTFEALRGEYSDRVRFVFKNYPIDPSCNDGAPEPGHDRACAAAEAAVCAGRQDRFWAFHDAVFARGTTETDLESAARQAGLDLDRWKQCRFGREAMEAVRADIADAREVGVRGTPTFLIGDQLVVGARPPEELAAEIERALSRAGGETPVSPSTADR